MAGGSRRRRREEAGRDGSLTQELTIAPGFQESQWAAGTAEPSGTGFGSHASQEYDSLNQQNDDDDEEKYLVGFVEVNVVGLQYYHGTVNNREMVRLIREPHNAYDRNAIRVENMWGEQVGHVERYKACYLAPLADQDNVAIEGIVPRGSRNVYRMPCQVFVFSTYPTMATVLSQLRCSGLNVVTPSDSHFEHLAAMAPDEKGKDAPEQTKSVDDIFDSLLLNRTKIPPAMDPSSVITTGLYLHQREALAWLVGRENSEDLPPFWEEQADKRGGGRPSYVNTLTNFMTNQKPEPFRGGILADEMGLGKTLTLISLIATNKTSLNETEAVERLTKQKKLEHSGFPAVNTKTRHSSSESTLVVCPLSVVSMWVTQLEEHTRSGSLKVYLYHGPERTKKASFLSSFDIVLTTYNILAAEGEDSRSPLQKVNWLRVILDEAHLVKNPNAQMTKAAISLTAERRWAVTGTPIQNGAKDLCSLMMFLKLQPLDDRSFWNRTIQRPLLNGETCGFLRLQALLMAIALRRTKDMMVNGKRLVELPKKTITVCNVDLSENDRRLYDKVEFEGKRLVGQYVESGTVLQNYTTILQIILRLRQICDHSSLCPLQESMLDTLPSAADLSSSPELLEKLLSALQSGDDFDCPICLSPPTMAIITKCSHIFCRRCIEKTLMHDKQSCPLCRAPLTAADLFSSVTQSTDTPASETTALELSAKIKALLEMLEESRRNDTAVKSVVFSQFSSMLTLVQDALEAAGFQCVRLDGSMSLKKREQALKAFQSNDLNSPSIFLLSLKAAGVGLNLVAASRVYMLDPWWNPAVEEQAMDRVHRLGQTHDVEVVRFIVKESIEERILQLQERKRNLANSAFEESPEQMRKTRVQDVQHLMQL